MLQKLDAVTDLRADAAHTLIRDTRHNYPRVLRKCLERGCDPDFVDAQGYSSVFHAACFWDFECLKVLIEFGADIGTRKPTYSHGEIRRPQMLLELGMSPSREHMISMTTMRWTCGDPDDVLCAVLAHPRLCEDLARLVVELTQ